MANPTDRVTRLGWSSAAGWLTCALILAAAWGPWLHRLGVMDPDDAASNEVLFARRPLPEVLFDVPWTDQAPLSFAVLHFWLAWGDDPATVRALNLALLSASLLLLYAVGRRLTSPPPVALLAVTLAAVSPASLWVVRNGRMYSLQLLLWMGTTYFVARYGESKKPLHLAGIVLGCVLGIYNHFVGWVSTATVILWLLVEAVMEARLSPPEQRGKDLRRRLGPPIAAGLAIFVLVQPQLMRLLALLQAPPAVVAGQAMPGGWLPFLDAVSWFWFMGAGWGALSSHAAALRAVYLAAAYLLFVAGLARGSARMRRLVAVTVVLPVVLIGLAAGRLDFRDRHLLYMLPLVWLAMANGVIGRAADGLPVPRAASRAAVALVAVVALASGWLLYQKLPEGYVEWTKLMDAIAQVRRPRTVLYMVPSPLTGTPDLIASRLDPTGALAVRPLSTETRHDFVAEAAEKRDFVFLDQQWGPASPERGWRTRYLEERGYRHLVLAAAGTTAQLFSTELPAFSSATRLSTPPSAAAAVAWARQRVADPSRRPRAATPLGRALVARLEGDGTIHESTVFMSQHGENGSWRLGPSDGDAVEEAKVPMGKREEPVVVARTTPDALLLVAFPRTSLARGLGLTCGVVSTIPAVRGADPVSIEVYVDGEAMAQSVCPQGRWSTIAVPAARGAAGEADVTVALAGIGVDRAEVLFRLDRPPQGAVVGRPARLSSPGPIALEAERTLQDHVEQLSVYRTGPAGFGRLEGRFETAGQSAEVMHEAPGPAGESGLGARWQLGELPWDAVGVTRQRSGGRLRSGLWAHPRDRTTLVVEADARMGTTLEGFYGLTDFAIERGAAQEVKAPIAFRVLVDGRAVLAREVPRSRGWTSWTVALPEPRTGRLRIEVDAAEDRWAHFVFDAWSR